MNRRSFNTMLGAAFGSVALGVTPIVKIGPEIDLLEYCDPESSRYDLSQPFIQAGHKIATDRHILVRMRSPGDLGQGDQRRVPDLTIFDWSAFDCRGWKPWPSLKLEEYGTYCSSCRTCRGYGYVNFRQCDCPGQRYYDDQNWCGKCDEGGQVGDLCPTCKCKTPNTNQAAVVNGKHLNQRHDSMIRDLMSVEFLPDGGHAVFGASTTRRGDAIPFRFDGGVGLVMPLNPRKTYA